MIILTKNLLNLVLQNDNRCERKKERGLQSNKFCRCCNKHFLDRFPLNFNMHTYVKERCICCCPFRTYFNTKFLLCCSISKDQCSTACTSEKKRNPKNEQLQIWEDMVIYVYDNLFFLMFMHLTLPIFSFYKTTLYLLHIAKCYLLKDQKEDNNYYIIGCKLIFLFSGLIFKDS